MIFKTENTSIIVKIIMVNVLLYLVLNAATLYGYYREDQSRIDAIKENNHYINTLQNKFQDFDHFGKKDLDDLVNFTLFRLQDEDDYDLKPEQKNLTLNDIDRPQKACVSTSYNKSNLAKEILNKINYSLPYYKGFIKVFVSAPKENLLVYKNYSSCDDLTTTTKEALADVSSLIAGSRISYQGYHWGKLTKIEAPTITGKFEETAAIPVFKRIKTKKWGLINIGGLMRVPLIDYLENSNSQQNFSIVLNRFNNKVYPQGTHLPASLIKMLKTPSKKEAKIPEKYPFVISSNEKGMLLKNQNSVFADQLPFQLLKSALSKITPTNEETTEPRDLRIGKYIITKQIVTSTPFEVVTVTALDQRVNIYKKHLLESFPLFVILQLVMAFVTLLILEKNFTLPLKQLIQSIKAKQKTKDNVMFRTNPTINEFNKGYNQLLSEIEEYNKNLEHKIQIRTKQLEAAKKSAELKSFYKEKEMDMLTHEIRTPLSSIMASGELLTKELKETSEQNKFLLKTINESSNVLLEQMNNLIVIRRIEAGHMNFQFKNVSILDIIEESASIFYPKLKRQKYTFTTLVKSRNMPEFIKTDSFKVKQILINIIGNAFKFSQDGTISLLVYVKNKHLFFLIKDDGLGISPEFQGKLFVPYTREHSNIKGIGLGLVLSKQLAQGLGGDIIVKSQPGKGSIFTLMIPLNEPQNVNFISPKTFNNKTISAPTNLWRQLQEWGCVVNDEQNNQYRILQDPSYPFSPSALFKKLISLKNEVSDDAASSNPHKKVADSCKYALKILVVDDVGINRDIFKIMLESLGHKVLTAGSGKEALHLGTKNVFDVVFMDIRMHVMNGVKASLKWKKNDEILDTDTPIISLTANEGIHNKFPVFFKNVTKPVSISTFQEVLQKVVIHQQDRGVELNILKQNETPMISDPNLKINAKKEIKRMINELDDYCANEKWNKVNDLLHIIKGSSGQFGYITLFDYINSIEDIVKLKQNSDLINPSVLLALLSYKNK